MTIGLMPVIGIPLPLFSYGGSSLFAFTLLFSSPSNSIRADGRATAISVPARNNPPPEMPFRSPCRPKYGPAQ